MAVKVVKAGLDTAAVVARFRAERQALALMDHPAIARVFDAGSTDQGRPYFAMEYVAGESLNTYADRHKLSIVERLELFIQICEGVQHAHQKGVIHRDLKPSNILVAAQGERPAPKIIDFGISKATTQELSDSTLRTVFGGFIGTPEYMSPEQAESGSVDVDTGAMSMLSGVLTSSSPACCHSIARHSVLVDSTGAPHPPRHRTATPEYAGHAGAIDRARGRGQPPQRSAAARSRAERRSRLDCAQGAGERPDQAVSNGQRAGARPASAPG